jgi:HEAT repeat protein
MDWPVESLVEALRDDDNDTREQAEEVLKQIGPAAFDQLYKLVSDHTKPPGTRMSAIELIGEIGGDEKVIPLLLDALEDENHGIQDSAAKTLQSYKHLDDPEPFRKRLLINRFFSVREIMAQILTKMNWLPQSKEEKIAYYIGTYNWQQLEKMGVDAVKPLLQLIEHGWNRLGKEAIQTLGKIEEPGVVDHLLKLLDHQTWYIRKEAASALGNQCDIRAIPYLASIMKQTNENTEVKNAALVALSKIDTPDSSEALFQISQRAAKDLKEKILELLNKRGWNPISKSDQAALLISQRQWPEIVPLGEEALAPLISAYKSSDKETRKELLDVIRQIGGQKAIEFIIHCLNDQHNEIQSHAEKQLKQIGPPTIIEPLLDAIPGFQSATRTRIFRILDESKWKPGNNRQMILYLIAQQKFQILPAMGKEAVEPLIKIASDRDPGIRQSVLQSLGELRDLRALEVIINALRDSNKSVEAKASKILKEWKNPGCVIPLLNSLEVSIYQNQSFQDLERIDKQQNTVIDILGAIADCRAIEPLIGIKKQIENSYLMIKSQDASNKLFVLDQSLNQIKEAMKSIDGSEWCSDCMHRYKKHKIKMGFFSSIRYYACRKCQSNAYPIHDCDKMILCLDHGMKEPYKINDKNIFINWYYKKILCDFNEIWIRNGSDSSIEELVMTLNNDNDRKRKKRLKASPCRLSPGLDLSRAKQNMLNSQFNIQPWINIQTPSV